MPRLFPTSRLGASVLTLAVLAACSDRPGSLTAPSLTTPAARSEATGDEDAPIQLTIANASGRESDGIIQFDVRLSRACQGTVFAFLGTTTVDATDYVDFIPPPLFVVFGPGQTTAPVSVPLVDDLQPESNETFGLSAFSVAGDCAVVPGAPATGTILDDDGEPEPPADVTPPQVSHTLSPAQPDGLNGWYRTDVTLTWTVTEPESPATLATDGCGAITITTDLARGFQCIATSAGGTTATRPIPIQRDATAPEITFAAAPTYPVDAVIEIPCVATDRTSGTTGCAGYTAVAASLPATMQTITRTAIDRAGNTSTAAATFRVVASAPSLCAVVRRVVSSPDVQDGLCDKLAAMATARNANAKAGPRRAFENQLRAQTAKSVSAADAAMLLRWLATI